GFAELAVADNVDTGRGLLSHGVDHGSAERRSVQLRVNGVAVEELTQRRRANQAADERGENSIRAAFHVPSRKASVRRDQAARFGHGGQTTVAECAASA